MNTSVPSLSFSKKNFLNYTCYHFPKNLREEVVGKIIFKSWGKSSNIIIFFDTEDSRKLKFTFWKNQNYCADLDYERSNFHLSLRSISLGTTLRITYENSGSYITRVKKIIVVSEEN